MAGRDLTSRTLALAASGAVVLAAFVPWTTDGRVGIDLRPWELAPISLGLVLIALAAPPAIGATLGRGSLPQVLGAVMGGTLVLVWLATGAAAGFVPGVLLTMAATVVWLHGAAVARR